FCGKGLFERKSPLLLVFPGSEVMDAKMVCRELPELSLAFHTGNFVFLNGRERVHGNWNAGSLKSRLCLHDRSPLLFGESHFLKRVIDSYQRLLDVLGCHFAYGSLGMDDFDR